MHQGQPPDRPRDGLSVAVVIPCLDEEATIGGVVSGFRTHLPGARIVVVDNASTDSTTARAVEAGAEILKAPIRGKGNAVRKALADVEADIYVMVDGDATYDPAAAPEMVRRILEEGEDLVNGVRIPVGDGAWRRGHTFGNRALSGLVQFMFHRKAPDMLSGYKAMSRRFVKSLPIFSRGFEVETEVTVHALELGVPIGEVRSEYRERPAHSPSKLSTYKDGVRILRMIVGLVRQGRPLAFFSALAVLLLAVSLVLGIPVLVTFFQIHKVPRLPTAVLSTGLVVLAALSLTAGTILDTVTRGRREAKMLRYLAVTSEGPLRARAVGTAPRRAEEGAAVAVNGNGGLDTSTEPEPGARDAGVPTAT